MSMLSIFASLWTFLYQLQPMLTVLQLDDSLQDKVTKSFPIGEKEVNNTVLEIFG